jgi:hypothetical protein
MAPGAPFVQRTSVPHTLSTTTVRKGKPASEHSARLVAFDVTKVMPEKPKNQLHELKAGDPKYPARQPIRLIQINVRPFDVPDISHCRAKAHENCRRSVHRSALSDRDPWVLALKVDRQS